MRLIRLTTNYPTYLAGFYARHPDLAKEPYAQQYKEIVGDAFGWANFWTHALSQLGYEVWEPIANAEPLQKAWADENDIPAEPRTWMHDIIAAQVIAFRPDVVFIDDYGAFDAAFVRRLRETVPSIRLVLGWCAAPFSDETVFGQYDVLLTSIAGVAEYFTGKGLTTEVINHAFHPSVLNRLGLPGPKRTFTFVGSIRPGEKHLGRRQALLRELSERDGLELFTDFSLPASPRPAQTFAQRILRVVTGKSLQEDEEILRWRAIAAKLNPGRFGLDMFQTLRDSELTFNAHSDFHGEWASNMRLYEATGVGTCLLTDWKKNLANLFEPDKEVVAYRSLAECREKARWLLDHPREREAVARAGQARTLRDHTFEQRAQSLDMVIKRSVGRPA